MGRVPLTMMGSGIICVLRTPLAAVKFAARHTCWMYTQRRAHSRLDPLQT